MEIRGKGTEGRERERERKANESKRRPRPSPSPPFPSLPQESSEEGIKTRTPTPWGIRMKGGRDPLLLMTMMAKKREEDGREG